MRKLLILSLIVFVVAAAVGYSTPDVMAKGGGGGGGIPSNCYYTCTCAGQPLYCCVWNGVEFCSPTSVFQCPQVYNC